MNAETQMAEGAQTPARNSHGSFIWYELIVPDPDAAATFYGDVVGWEARSAGMEGFDYRLFSSRGVDVAGFMATQSPDMRPGWLGYIGVDDVDAAVAKITEAGGAVHMPPMDVAGVGRMAMVADPQAVPFYVMRGEGDAPSASFQPMTDGHCCWNELATSDPQAALDFYGDQFGWTKGDAMPMGDMGDYQFVQHGDETIGAVMGRSPDGPRPAWTFCFRVPDIDAAKARTTENGGVIVYGPVEVPGGDMVVGATDPQGAGFLLLAPGKPAGE